MNVSMRGQIIVLFAASLILILAIAGLLVDGGFLLTTHRKAQAAADTAALAAAEAASRGAGYAAAAQTIAGDNGFPNTYTDCNGTARTDGVVVNRPPSNKSAVAHRTSDYVEVITTRPMHTIFAKVLGMPCFLVTARAVASIKSSAVATCNFCATSSGGWNHVLLLDNGADLRVDGEVYINGTAGVNPINPTTCKSTGSNPQLAEFHVCGDAFDLKHSGGQTATYMSAKSISVVGGWETHGGSVAHADELAATCPYHFEPPGYAGLVPKPVGNVCIAVPQLVDPLNDPANPGNIINPPDPNSMTVPTSGQNGCVAKPGTTLKIPTGTFANPQKLVISLGPQDGKYTICPGIYYGGFAITEHFNPRVTMLPGVYFMAGGGFSASHGTWVDGSAGVMIYNSGEAEAFSSSTSPGQDLVPACDPAAPSACIKPTVIGGGNGLGASANNIAPNVSVTYTFTVQGTVAKGSPTGTMTFYDGDNVITGCLNKPVTAGSGQRASATCITSYPLFGNRAISAVYVNASCRTAPKCYGDANYAPVGDNLTETIKPQPKGAMDNVQVVTTGQVLLTAPTSGRYSGLLIFQDRASGLNVTISSGSGLGACPANFMTAGVPPNTNPVPNPCGQLGGLSGTIYAPHQGPDLSTSATVDLAGSGLANLQIIAAQISLHTTDQDVRFAFRPEVFANGNIHLVE